MKRTGRFLYCDNVALTLILAAAILLAGRSWLRDHPQHDPWAPLELRHAMGWATGRKIAELREDTGVCHAFLDRSGIAVEELSPTGEGACLRGDRLRPRGGSIEDVAINPAASAQATCPVHAGMAMWLHHGVQPAAQAILGSRVARIEHLGTANCRRIGGGDSGRWSEHATGNAIDVGAFILADGRRVSLLGDWRGDGPNAAFLRAVRDSACEVFGTVLSPDYNADHADHFHLDQMARGWRVCR